MNRMKIFITAQSQQLPPAGIPGCGVAHLDYTIGPGKRLLRSSRSRAFRGGLLVVSDKNMPTGDSGLFASDLVRECQNKGYTGVVANFGAASLHESIQNRLSSKGLRLYVPQSLGELARNAQIMCATAISGGSLAVRLKELCDKFGAGRIALDIERLAMDFLLPSPTGEGTPLSRDELNSLLKKRGAQSFFSNDLCAHYFTYSENGKHHFVLYDTAASIKNKLSIAQSLGIEEAFLMYSEVDDVLQGIINN